ncbi:hypothetical protein [Canibacter zhoujuaniae]|uniref:hypothetical protein n=1 Tax=Canibacter zhoujuaniae TaxID=2708343 RepID=UPI00141E5447|nr:hypothetical protein [Canibacter zhoujuaniae]
MARVEIYSDRLILKFSRSEQFTSMLPGTITIPRAQILTAISTSDPWLWVRGVPKRGIHLPNRLARGIWKHRGGQDIVFIRKGAEAFVLDLDSSAPDVQMSPQTQLPPQTQRILVSSSQAALVMQELIKDGTNLPPEKRQVD